MAIGLFIPIFAFLLIFVVVYALLKKTEVLGGNDSVMLLISFILATFFIVEASLVELVVFSSGWLVVVVIIVFFLIAILGFLPGKEPLGFLTKGNWISWVLLAVIIGVFIISAVYVFNFAINWKLISEWLGTEWFGMILLLIIALIVSFVITKK